MKSPLHRPALLFSSLLVLLVAGCALPGERETEVTFAEALAFEPIGRGQTASLDTTATLAIRDAATWAVYQDSLHPARPFEAVNFEQEMVVLVAVPVPSGGYSVTFETVEKDEDGLTAHYILSEPGYDCLITMGKAVPFEAIRVAKTEGPLRFEQVQEAYRCTE